MSNTIAQTILTQLGGNRFLAMTGAKDLVNTGKGLQFAIGRGASNSLSAAAPATRPTKWS